MASKAKSLVFRIVATIPVLIWGLGTGLAMIGYMIFNELPFPPWMWILAGGTVIISLLALVWIWWPRKADEPASPGEGAS